MPRGKKSNGDPRPEIKKGKYAASEQGEVEWGGFINCQIDSDTKLIYAEWVTGEGEAFWSLLEDVMGEGLKYGLSFDAENSCYIATLTGCGWVGDHRRFCLTARSGRFEDATALLLFKHCVLAEGDWGNYKPRTRSFLTWG